MVPRCTFASSSVELIAGVKPSESSALGSDAVTRIKEP